MPKWARTFMLLTGMLTWIGIVAVTLLLGQVPDAWIIGFPVSLWLALKGESRIRRGRASRDEPAVTDREGDSA